MTVVTGGCYDQAGFEKAPSMDALGIVLHNIMLRYIIHPGHHFAFPVTGPAKDGDIHFIGARFWICIRQNIMMPVALLTTVCIVVIHQQGLSVNAPHVVFHLAGMAVAAIHRIQILGMGEALIGGIRMTGQAGVAVMNGM